MVNEDIGVRTVNLSKSYGSAPSEVQALKNISLEIGRGQKIALLGKSGSGKSTLLNLLAGLDQPTSGSIWVAGRDLAAMTPNALAEYRLTTVGMIFQTFNLIPSRTALQNVELPLVFAGRRPKERRIAALHALEAVEMGHRLHHRPAELSGGEQQRVAIARALVNKPQLLLADEPTGNLDTETAGTILDLLTALSDHQRTTLLLVTHDHDLAARSADRILHMKDGQLVL